MTRSHDAPISLVGWSLGGIYAREVAKRLPTRARQVITIGTPFAGAPRTHPRPVGLPFSQWQEAAIQQGIGPAAGCSAPGAHHLDFQSHRWGGGVAGVHPGGRRTPLREHRSHGQPLWPGLEQRGVPGGGQPLVPNARPVATHGLRWVLARGGPTCTVRPSKLWGMRYAKAVHESFTVNLHSIFGLEKSFSAVASQQAHAITTP